MVLGNRSPEQGGGDALLGGGKTVRKHINDDPMNVRALIQVLGRKTVPVQNIGGGSCEELRTAFATYGYGAAELARRGPSAIRKQLQYVSRARAHSTVVWGRLASRSMRSDHAIVVQHPRVLAHVLLRVTDRGDRD